MVNELKLIAQAIIELDYQFSNGRRDGLEGDTLQALRAIWLAGAFDEEDRLFREGAEDLIAEGRAVANGDLVTLKEVK